MGLMEKIKKAFISSKVPEETLNIVLKAKNKCEVREALDKLLAKNVIELEKAEETLSINSRAIEKEKGNIRNGGLTADEEKTILRRIIRLENMLKSFRNRVNILNANVNLHQNLILKIDEIEALELQGVSAELIDNLAETEKGKVEVFKETELAAADASSNISAIDTEEEDAELAKLKKEIMGENNKSNTKSGVKNKGGNVEYD